MKSLLALYMRVVHNTADRVRWMSKMAWVRWVAFVGALVIMGNALAEEPVQTQAGKKSEIEKRPDIKSGRKGPIRVFHLDEVVVKGKIQKPHVEYIIDRGELNREGLRLEKSLLEEIKGSVEGPPF